MDRLLLKVHEAAASIAVGRSTMYRLLGTGEIQGVRVGSSLRVPVAALRAWIDAHSSESARQVEARR